MQELFFKAIDDGKYVRVVFCDLSKAFDRVWHEGLLLKLHNVGVRGELLQWFNSYLSDRKQRVVIAGQKSEWETVEAGVPQGSVLGPLLFLLYINDITAEVDCNIKIYADDITIFTSFKNPPDGSQTLNHNLEKNIGLGS